MTAWVTSGHRADALVEAGDDVYPDGDPSRFAAALDVPYAELRRTRPLWVALGNHDEQAGHGNEQLRYLDLPDMPYAKTLPGVQLLFLDANHPDQAQAEWLDARLSEPGPPFRVVVFHQPAFSCGPHGSTRAVDRWWVPVLEQHHVALVLNGHDHYYERFRSANDVTYLVNGAAGAELYLRLPGCRGTPASQATYAGREFVGVEVTGPELTLRAVDRAGKVVDQAVISR
jgi:3',5'-cyclic AMP phosphodiesterase CpdA